MLDGPSVDRGRTCDDAVVETRRLELLLELSRWGSMRAVADETGLSTSAVSQQIAALAREVGAPLVEPVGRGVRLTAAGRRLADHAVAILAAVEAAQRDLDPSAEPAGTVRVAGFASAVRRSLIPLVSELRASHPDVELVILEHEPAEAFALLARDAVDLVLAYDYDLAPVAADPALVTTPLWTVPWGLAVPASARVGGGTSLEVVARHRDDPWIVNSRGTADEEAARTLASMAGFAPRVVHRVDSLELVADLVRGGLGVGLLPESADVGDGVVVLSLHDPAVVLRAYAAVRRGRERWAPLALVLGALG